jgi:hypothetical protein
MKKFSQWLNESMTVSIQDHDHHNDIKNLDDLANFLKRKVYYPLENKLSPEELENIRNGGSTSHMIITPDGGYYNGENNIINFYSHGLEKYYNTIMNGIKYYLDELKIKYGPFKIDTSGMFQNQVTRIPIINFKPSDNAAPMINLSNANAYLIFNNLLGFHPDDGGFTIPAVDLLRKIEEIEKDQIDLHARDPYSTKTQNGPTFHHMGLDSAAITQRLNIIKNIAQWAIQNHYDTISVY